MRGRIDGLIRLQRWQLDEKRRNLAELEGMRQDFVNRIAHLDAEVEREKAMAAADDANKFHFSEFVQATLGRKQSIQDSIARIDTEIEAARDEVQAAFQDLKKMETVDARQQKERKVARERKVQGDLDEMAIMRHSRAAKR